MPDVGLVGVDGLGAEGELLGYVVRTEAAADEFEHAKLTIAE